MLRGSRREFLTSFGVTVSAHPPRKNPAMTTFVDGLERRRAELARTLQTCLTEARSQGRQQMNAHERAMCDDLRGLTEHIAELRDDEARSHIPAKYANLGRGGREVKTAGRLSPLGYTDEQLRRAFDQIGRGETAVLEKRDPGFAGPLTPLVPPELGPILPVFPRHEDRLLDRLPGVGIDVPAIAYVEVVSTTGTATIVPEGGQKPELLMPATQQVAAARKIAAHVGISWESFNDYAAFVSSVQGELMRCIVDAENLQLYGGTGDANNQVNGLTTNPNILTLAAGALGENYTDISAGIAALRNGPALATCDLILMNPETWAAIRVQKDQYGRFLIDPDPSVEQANTVFGIDVVVSTQFTAGVAVLFDTRIYGRAIIREPIITRIGYNGTDFTQNIVRYVSEERITQTIERPQAILKLTGLPTTAPTVADTKPAAAKK
jgi:HK97 family phage major capsid protein